DDDHAATAARTWTRQQALLIRGGLRRFRLFRGRSGEQLASVGDIGGTVCFGKQPVVTDAMQAFWQNVDEEAADELVGGERHRLVAGRAVGPKVLVLEGAPVFIGGHGA